MITAVTNSLAIKVRIRNSAGQYLVGDPISWGFSNDVSRAMVLDYQRHRVAEQLELIRRNHGVALEAVPVDPREVYETCDRCERLVTPFAAFFDGARFFCPDCLTKAASGQSAPLSVRDELAASNDKVCETMDTLPKGEQPATTGRLTRLGSTNGPDVRLSAS
jgi:hypothetical protein